jgi:hypothetical protein
MSVPSAAAEEAVGAVEVAEAEGVEAVAAEVAALVVALVAADLPAAFRDPAVVAACRGLLRLR